MVGWEAMIMICVWYITNRLESSKQCQFDIGLQSTTYNQHQTSIVSTSGIFQGDNGDVSYTAVIITGPCESRHDPPPGLFISQ